MPGPVVIPDSSPDKSSRQHVVAWVNRLLETHFKDVHEMASGACHCQIMDGIFPGSVDLTKVKFDAHSEDDCKHNFSLLQDAFNKKDITKAIPVDDLIKRDSKSSYEFLKWLKVLHAANEHDEEYDPVKARNGQKISPFLVSRPLRSSKLEQGNCELESNTRSNCNGIASNTFPYSEKWKEDFNWANPSALGEQYTFCSFCHANLCTVQTGYNELKKHENTNKHNKNANILLSQDLLNEPLACSDAAVRFIHSHCYSGTAGGEQAAEHLARCKLGWQYPQKIRSVCHHTPYCVYIYKGVPMGKNDMVSVVLVGYFDIEASRHCIQFLDALQSDGPGEQTDAVVVQTLKKFDLPADHLAVYYNNNVAASEQTCSHLREFNQNVLALGGLYTVADAACLAGVKELSSQTQEFMAELHAHYSSCSTNNDKLKVLFGSDISKNNKPFYLHTSCLTFCQFVSNILDMWADLLLHFSSCHKDDDKAKLVCSQMKNPKVKATFMFLDQALKPLQKYQRETQGASWASMPLILEEASTLLGTYTSYFLQPHAATCYLEEHDTKILQNKKFHLSSLGFSLGKKPSEDADTLSQLREEALLFYIAITDCISKELPLNDTVLKSIAQLLTPQKGLKVTKAAVEELGTSLGICSSPKEVQQLIREFNEYWLAEDEKSKDEELVSLEEHWTRVLKDTKPKSMFRKLVLTLLSFPCPPLDAQHVVTQALQNGDSVIFAESEDETGSDCYVTPDSSPNVSSKDSQTHNGKTNDPRALLKACEVRLSRINYPFDGLSTKGTFRGRSGLKNNLRERPPARTMFQAGVSTWSKPTDLDDDFRVHKSRDKSDDNWLNNLLQVRGRSKEYEDEKGFLTGELLWGKVKGFSWWPGMVVAWKSKFPPPGMRRVAWFGDGMFSEAHADGLLPFEAFSRCFCKNSFTSFPAYREAIYQIIELASVRCRKQFSEADGNKEKQLKLMVDWAFEGFLPTGPKGFSPPDSSPRSESPESSVSDYQPPQKKKSVGKKAAASAVTYNRESLKEKIKEKNKTIEDFCLSCASPEVDVPHPIFEGGLCLKCKENFTETLYRYDDDGYQSYCTVCCAGTEVVLCCNSNCCRCFCKDCLNILVAEGTFDKVQEVDPWSCYICVPSQCEGYLRLRPNWSVKLQDFFANDSAMAFEPHRIYPCVPVEQRRPLRVLSLFDGIATGYLVLKELGLKVERYIASEICTNSITVAMVKHEGRIEHVNDARAITRRHLAEWGPFDLLIGGSPCNDLALVNPNRKGLFEGTGRLFFEYYRILNLLKPKEDDNRPFFWLFENVVFMGSRDKSDICRFLECNPVLVDAVKVSPAHRARYFWGNIPGMNRPITASQSDKVLLQDCLEIGRKAMTDKIRTVTTHGECMKMGKKGPLPVTMMGKEDYLWSSELETVFGFPKHYTDVNHMSRTCRQKLLGKSWSVPVVRHLLAPLKDYFECEAGQ